jgi:bifunctional non-homologous end joining protein LigD
MIVSAEEKTNLWYYDNWSDKVYNVFIVDKGSDKFVVNFTYGRRGSTLNKGTKTPTPVSLEKAQAIYGKLINDKLSKGYKKR